jgi:hypothetical protein
MVIGTAAPRCAHTWQPCSVTVAVVEHYCSAHDLRSFSINRGAGQVIPFYPSLPLLPRALHTSSAPQLDQCIESLRCHRSPSRRCQFSPLLCFFLNVVVGLLLLLHIGRGDPLFSASSLLPRLRHTNTGEFFLWLFSLVSLHLLSSNLSGLNLQ